MGVKLGAGEVWKVATLAWESLEGSELIRLLGLLEGRYYEGGNTNSQQMGSG